MRFGPTNELGFKVTGKGGSYASASVDPPVFGALTFADGMGFCGESRFPGPAGVSPSCTVKAATATVVCK
jgi:hypothetical protein